MLLFCSTEVEDVVFTVVLFGFYTLVRGLVG